MFKSRWAKSVGAAIVAGLVVVGQASAVTQIDWSAAVTDLTAEVLGAMTAALPVFVIIVAIGAGIRLFKRLVGG